VTDSRNGGSHKEVEELLEREQQNPAPGEYRVSSAFDLN